MSGNGTLNAFAASTFGYDFVVVHSELFSNTYEKNRDALAFIIGHELGHLRLGHTRLWYQLSTAYTDRVPLARGFPLSSQGVSCDRHGAYLAPRGEEGLLLLSAGRYVYKEVDVGELMEQARRFRGFWPVLPSFPSRILSRAPTEVLYDARVFRGCLRGEGGDRWCRDHRNLVPLQVLSRSQRRGRSCVPRACGR